MTHQKRDSVAKGGSSVAIARMVGMVFSFLLFILLARKSAESAGMFKTVMTYVIIAESLGMLGLQGNHRIFSIHFTAITDDLCQRDSNGYL